MDAKQAQHTPGRRFACVWCGASGPMFLRPTEHFPDTDSPTRSGSIHQMDPEGLFCRLRCAARYGVRAAIAKATGQEGGAAS